MLWLIEFIKKIFVSPVEIGDNVRKDFETIARNWQELFDSTRDELSQARASLQSAEDKIDKIAAQLEACRVMQAECQKHRHEDSMRIKELEDLVESLMKQ